MAKNKSHKWTLDEFLDSMRDHIGHIIDNLGARDIIYLLSWISATILIYNGVTGIKKIIVGQYFIYGAPEGRLRRFFEENLTIPESAKEDGAKLSEIDWNIFMLSMVGAYALLKIDVADVQSAVSKLQSAIITQAGAIK